MNQHNHLTVQQPQQHLSYHVPQVSYCDMSHQVNQQPVRILTQPHHHHHHHHHQQMPMSFAAVQRHQSAFAGLNDNANGLTANEYNQITYENAAKQTLYEPFQSSHQQRDPIQQDFYGYTSHHLYMQQGQTTQQNGDANTTIYQIQDPTQGSATYEVSPQATHFGTAGQRQIRYMETTPISNGYVPMTTGRGGRQETLQHPQVDHQQHHHHHHQSYQHNFNQHPSHQLHRPPHMSNGTVPGHQPVIQQNNDNYVQFHHPAQQQTLMQNETTDYHYDTTMPPVASLDQQQVFYQTTTMAAPPGQAAAVVTTTTTTTVQDDMNMQPMTQSVVSEIQQTSTSLPDVTTSATSVASALATPSLSSFESQPVFSQATEPNQILMLTPQQTAATSTTASSNSSLTTTTTTTDGVTVLSGSRSSDNSPIIRGSGYDCPDDTACIPRSLSATPFIDSQLISRQSQQDYLDMRSSGSVSSDWLDTICRHLIEHMNHFGICVIDNFLGSIKGELILEEVQQLYSSGQYTKGRLVSNKLGPSQQNGNVKTQATLSTETASSANSPTSLRAQRDGTGSIRSDRVIWIDGCEEGCSEINNLIQTLCSVITNSSRLSLYSNNGLDKIVIKKRTKAHVACYPGNGTRYIKHIDNPNGDGRVITAIYYLNKNWNTKRDGGLLRMFPAGMDEVANIEPLFDRVLFFWSDRRNPHEVLPAYRDRFAITVWYIGESRP